MFYNSCVPIKKPISNFSQFLEVISRSDANISPKQWVFKGLSPILNLKWVLKISN